MTSGANFIADPRAWRISKSGFSIRTGWAGDKRIIAQYEGPRSPMDNEAFRKWFESAEKVCELHNAVLHERFQAGADAARREDAGIVNERRFNGETDLRSIRDEILSRVGRPVKDGESDGS